MNIETLPTHPGTGLTAIGIVGGKPVWPIYGAAEGETGEGNADGGDEDDPGEGDGETEGQGDDWTAPTKDEWERLQAKLKRANAQAKKLREASTGTAPAKAAPAKAAPAKKAAPAPAEPAEESTTAADDGELERWQVRAIRADARAALVERGCDPKMVNLALGLLKPNEVEFDGDDPILDDWLDDIEADYPALFAKTAAPAKATNGTRKAGSIDQGAATTGNPPKKQQGFGEALLERGGWGDERRSGIAGRRR